MLENFVCKRCGCKEILTMLNSGDDIHYSRIVCNDCGTFVQWGKKPSAEMQEKKKQYNELLHKLQKAEDYFQMNYANANVETQQLAVEKFIKLNRQLGELYMELRPENILPDLQFGFTDGTMTINIDLIKEHANIIERLDIIRADEWEVEEMELRKDDMKLLVKFKRKQKQEESPKKYVQQQINFRGS